MTESLGIKSLVAADVGTGGLEGLPLVADSFLVREGLTVCGG